MEELEPQLPSQEGRERGDGAGQRQGRRRCHQRVVRDRDRERESDATVVFRSSAVVELYQRDAQKLPLLSPVMTERKKRGRSEIRERERVRRGREGRKMKVGVPSPLQPRIAAASSHGSAVAVVDESLLKLLLWLPCPKGDLDFTLFNLGCM
ncbi:hypothetical protein PIB30_047011 [Stylosanthes scabra]|uniref:Uncharacterized protein n=1 Tax=Stylosanthes scabra TaxID=79078 RepID=A0ABU6YIC9_9FABA|nr:hypothetical protein [Stylosanthes scabra]